MKYDYLVVGAGLFGSVFAYEAKRRGCSVAVVDKRNHIGGNCYTENVGGIEVHRYGAHIFRTSSKEIWNYIRQFSEFNNFINSPIANYKGQIYNLPFNMNTFSRLWGVVTPDEARQKISEQSQEIVSEPKNLEEKAISLIGRELYEILIKEYTEKQWGRPCHELPASIIRRLPVRFTYDNNYFRDPYQGIPVDGYTAIIRKMLDGCDVRLGVDYLKGTGIAARKVIYTGPIDEYYQYACGPLEYRSLRFEHERLACDNYQGVAVVNYTGSEVPYTRIIEHKHFVFGQQSGTVISREYPIAWAIGLEPYYPINDERNTARYNQYKERSKSDPNIVFCGRLGSYQYTDMQDTIGAALALARTEFV